MTLTIPFTLSGIAADGPLLHCIGQGNFFVPHDTTHCYPIQMFLCPSASETILSPQHACQTSAHLHGFKLDCTNRLANLTFYDKTGNIILSIPLSTYNNLYYLPLPTCCRITRTQELELWHHCLGHPGIHQSHVLPKHSTGLPKNLSTSLHAFQQCSICIEASAQR